jgi:hypothetical protein
MTAATGLAGARSAGVPAMVASERMAISDKRVKTHFPLMAWQDNCEADRGKAAY